MLSVKKSDKNFKIITNVARLHDSFKEVCVVAHKCVAECGAAGHLLIILLTLAADTLDIAGTM